MDLETIKLATSLISELNHLRSENERLKNEIEFLRSLLKPEKETEKIIIPKTEDWERGKRGGAF
jgi:hypothetical protein